MDCEELLLDQMVINDVQHPEVETPEEEEDSDDMELPDAIILTNLPKVIFEDQSLKTDLESLLKEIDPHATFLYFKAFRRARINFTSPEKAAQARICFNQVFVGGSTVRAFFAQPLEPPPKDKDGNEVDRHLRPPSPDRQFLISPPASPPVGWTQIRETEPNRQTFAAFDLITALASLAPGQDHVLYRGTPGTGHPTIVVSTAEDIEPLSNNQRPPNKIVQTRRPPVK